MMRGSSRRAYPRVSTLSFCCHSCQSHPLHLQSQVRFSFRNIHSISNPHSPISIQSSRPSPTNSKSRLSFQRSTLSNFHSFNLQQRNLPISSFDVHTPRSKPKTDPHWLKRQELSRRKVENKKLSQDLGESNAARNLDPILFQVRKALDNKDLLKATELARELQEGKSRDTRHQDPTSHPNLISNLTFNEYLKAFDQFNLILNKLGSGSNSIPQDLKTRFEFWQDNFFQFIKDGTNPIFDTQSSREESLVLLAWARIRSVHGDKLIGKDREKENDSHVANVIASWFSEVEIGKQASDSDQSVSQLPLPNPTSRGKVNLLNLQQGGWSTMADLITLLIISRVRISLNSSSSSNSVSRIKSESQVTLPQVTLPRELKELLSLVRLLPLGLPGLLFFKHSSRKLLDEVLGYENADVKERALEWMRMVELSRGSDVVSTDDDASGSSHPADLEREVRVGNEEQVSESSLGDEEPIKRIESKTTRTSSNRLARLFGSLFAQNKVEASTSLIRTMMKGFEFGSLTGQASALHSWLWVSSLPKPSFLPNPSDDTLQDSTTISGTRSSPNQPDWTPVTSSILLSGLLRSNQTELASELWSLLCRLEKAQSDGKRTLPSDSRIWTGLLSGYIDKGDYQAVDSTWELLMKNYKFGIGRSSVGQKSIGPVENSIYIDGAAFTVMINSLFKSKRPQEAMTLFSEMRRMALERKIYDSSTSTFTSKVPVETFNTVLHGLSIFDRLEEAMSLFKEMISQESSDSSNPKPSIATLNTLLRSSSRMGDMEALILILKSFEVLGLEPDVVTYTTVLDAFLRINSTSFNDSNPQSREEEEALLKEQNERDEKSVETILEIMESMKVKPNHATYTAMINNLLNPTPITPSTNHHLKRGRMALTKRDVKNLKRTGSRIAQPRIVAAMNLLSRMERGGSLGHDLKPTEVTYGLFLQSLNSEGGKMALMPSFDPSNPDPKSKSNSKSIFTLPKPYRNSPRSWNHLSESESEETLNHLHQYLPSTSISFNILHQLRKSNCRENRKIHHFLLNSTLSKQRLYVSNPENLVEKDWKILRRVDRLIWNRACSLLDEMIFSVEKFQTLIRNNKPHPFTKDLNVFLSFQSNSKLPFSSNIYFHRIRRNLQTFGLDLKDLPNPNPDTWHIVLKALLSRLDVEEPNDDGFVGMDFESTTREEIKEKIRLTLTYADKMKVDFRKIGGESTLQKALNVLEEEGMG